MAGGRAWALCCPLGVVSSARRPQVAVELMDAALESHVGLGMNGVSCGHACRPQMWSGETELAVN